jgi:hypothetical protein
VRHDAIGHIARGNDDYAKLFLRQRLQLRGKPVHRAAVADALATFQMRNVETEAESFLRLFLVLLHEL